jgi:hypothetical protein
LKAQWLNENPLNRSNSKRELIQFIAFLILFIDNENK